MDHASGYNPSVSRSVVCKEIDLTSETHNMELIIFTTYIYNALCLQKILLLLLLVVLFNGSV